MARIAVVEDDYDLSRVIRDVLRESGHDVVSYFQPSSDIVENIRNYNPDLIVLDVRLNDSITGWNIIFALKADGATSDIPVILCSGASEQIAEHRAWLDEQHVPVLPKPFDLAELEALVDRLLLGRRDSIPT